MTQEAMTRGPLFTSSPHEEWGAPLSVDFSPVRAGQEILVSVAYNVMDADGHMLHASPESPERNWGENAAFGQWRGNDERSRLWVHVRTEDGLEGWVAFDNLEHD